jgi:hypothetical protein
MRRSTDNVTFEVPGPSVIMNDFGDEVVVANLTSGLFYSVTGAYQEMWNRLIEGWSPGQIRGAFGPAGEGLHEALNELVMVATEGALLTASRLNGDALLLEGMPAPIFELVGSLECFDDLQGALLLDPVHDAGEQGWPYAPPVDASSDVV